MLEQRIESFKQFAREYWINRLNRGFSGTKIAGMYIPTLNPREAQKIFGRSKYKIFQKIMQNFFCY